MDIDIEKKIRENDYDGAVKSFEKLLIEHTNDFNLKIKYALFLQSTFVDNYPKALEVIESILSKNPFNTSAILLKGYIEDIFMGQVSNSTIDMVDKCIYGNNHHEEYFEQLFLLKAFYFRFKNADKWLFYLLESIKIDSNSSYNYYLIYQYYLKEKKIDLAKENINKALRNIKKVYELTDIINPIDFNEFINEKYRGVYISKINYETMRDEAMRATISA